MPDNMASKILKEKRKKQKKKKKNKKKTRKREGIPIYLSVDRRYKKQMNYGTSFLNTEYSTEENFLYLRLYSLNVPASVTQPTNLCFFLSLSMKN